MKKLAILNVLTHNQEDALKFYTEKLGFEVAEDVHMGDFRWLTVKLPGNSDCCLCLELAKTEEQKATVGKQGAGYAFIGIHTDNCVQDYKEMKSKGVLFEGQPKEEPFGTGVMLQDLYGNKIYMNQEAN